MTNVTANHSVQKIKVSTSTSWLFYSPKEPVDDGGKGLKKKRTPQKLALLVIGDD